MSESLIAIITALQVEIARLKSDKQELVEAISSLLNIDNYDLRKAMIYATIAKHSIKEKP